MRPANFKDIKGERFGRVVVVRLLDKRDKWGHPFWECLCDCGKTFSTLGKSLRSGNTSSCGCFRDEQNLKAIITHGHSRGKRHSREYMVWHSMKQRCELPTKKDYRYYGGRGIKVCERWSSFENFLQDMGSCPDGSTIDRIDNDGDYTPENCRWATRTQQNSNRRDSVRLTAFGVTMNQKQWSDLLGCNYGKIQRQRKQGLDMETIVKSLTADEFSLIEDRLMREEKP